MSNRVISFTLSYLTSMGVAVIQYIQVLERVWERDLGVKAGDEAWSDAVESIIMMIIY